ncbi:MAG: phage tail protein [Acidobacteria bacterium]|nr:phage tail protein [Acidobacteriota bacterium]|tara:strand:+ start:10034 stop:12016 length:1983 start_codon:yes stop_codon:yes gene_type:complete
MAQLSPGINTRETTITSSIVRASTGRAAMVGKFNWGSAYRTEQVTQEADLVSRFGQPDNSTYESVLSGINFLKYGSDLRVVRILNEDTAKNATAIYETISYTIATAGDAYAVGDTVTVRRDGAVVEENGKVTEVDTDGKIQSVYIPNASIIATAKENGEYPDLSADWTVDVDSNIGTGASITTLGIVTDSGLLTLNDEDALDKINGTFSEQCKAIGIPNLSAKYAGTFGNQMSIEIASYADWQANDGIVELEEYPTGNTRTVDFRSNFSFGPINSNQYAIMVRQGEVIREAFIISTQEDDRDVYGTNIYVTDYLDNGRSQFVNGSALNFPDGFSGILRLRGGNSGTDVSASEWQQGWDLFSDPDTVYVNLLIGGTSAGESVDIASTVQKYVAGISEQRFDSLALISPPRELIVGLPLNTAVDNLVAWRKGVDSQGQPVDDNMSYDSSYIAIDGNYKMQYDKYNDVYRWMPLSADIAGLCVYTDRVEAPWASPAGLNRGRISDVRKLAIEPKKPHRDRMYQVSINPVFTYDDGSGVVLYGDKTGSQNPTPFDRINVRRLFNLLKKSIGESSKYKLFEINDEFTRNSFKSEVSGYLSNIKNRNGVIDFRVISDTSNNTPDVVDRNEFVGTIYIKPPRSINFITLNFVATDTGVNFDEIIGQE